jgi:predicted phage tail protein
MKNFRLAVILVIGLVAMLAGTTAASARWWRDRTPPTPPGNLEVMDVGADYIALSWDASFDWSFNFSYRIYREDLSQPVTVPRTQTTYVWNGLGPDETYSFHVEAVDAAGNVSAPSNTATGTTTNGNDTPPTAPYGVTVMEVTSTSVSLWWEPATDDVGVSGYIIYNGAVPYGSVTPTDPTSARVNGLAYETTYEFYVVAEDTSGQEGPPSETVTATTLESVDTTPPSAPRNLYVAADVGCGNFFLDWTESDDVIDPQWKIRYDVYLDDEQEPRGSVTGDYFIELHVDIDPGSTHSFYLKAVDTSGNESESSNTFTETDTCP